MENMGAAMGEKPTKQRVILVLILLVTLLIAYLDRVNVSVLLADNTFLSDMGIKGQPVQMGLLMTLFLIAYGIICFVRGISSAGRALHWQCRGQRFDPAMLHQEKTVR